MTNLPERILEQLHKRGPMPAVSVPLAFGATEEECASAIDELLADKRVFRLGARVFPATGGTSTESARGPSGPQRLIDAPPVPPERIREPRAMPAPATRSAEVIAIAGRSAPAQQTEGKLMAETKMCSKCAKRKPLDDFYTNQAKCKRCFLDDQKASKQARRAASGIEGGGSPKPKRSAPAKSTNGAGAKTNGSAKVEPLAVINIPNGFRLGPLHTSVGGLIHMPYHVDLSIEQLDELYAIREAAKA